MVKTLLKLSVIEKEILDALLTKKPKVIAKEMNIDIQKVYNTKSYFRLKVQNAEEFLAVSKSKYKPLLSRKMKTPRIMPYDYVEVDE